MILQIYWAHSMLAFIFGNRTPGDMMSALRWHLVAFSHVWTVAWCQVEVEPAEGSLWLLGKSISKSLCLHQTYNTVCGDHILWAMSKVDQHVVLVFSRCVHVEFADKSMHWSRPSSALNFIDFESHFSYLPRMIVTGSFTTDCCNKRERQQLYICAMQLIIRASFHCR